jgi:hypothetical protein
MLATLCRRVDAYHHGAAPRELERELAIAATHVQSTVPIDVPTSLSTSWRSSCSAMAPSSEPRHRA